MHVKLNFRIVEVVNQDAITEFVGHEHQNDHIRRQIRRYRGKVDAVIDVVTNDGYLVRLKPLIVTEGRVTSSMKKVMRRTVTEIITTFGSSCTYPALQKAILGSDMETTMVKALNSIAKVRSAVIAKSELLKTGVVSSEGPTLDEIHAAEQKAEAELKARKEAAESGEEETLEWEWESNNPGEYIIIVETTKEDENHRNDDKEIDLDVEMVHLPEISTFNQDKEGEPGAKLEFNIVIKNSASGTDTFYLDMVGSAEDWGSMTNQMEMKSNESKDIELQITIPDDAEYDLYDLTIILTAGDVTETLDLTIDVTDNPTNYEVEISVSPTNTESVAGQDVEFSVTIYNNGDETDTFDLEVLGDESEWVQFEENGITIGADGEATVNGIISIPDEQDDGNVYIEVEATSRGDETAKDDKTIRVSVEELETGVTLRREGSGLRTVAPGESDTIMFNILSDGNGKQSIEVVAESQAGNWVVLEPATFDLDVDEAKAVSATVNVPLGTSDATYRLEILIFDDNGNELAKSISNIVVQTPIEEIQDVSLCFADLSNLCLDSANFEITIEASKIQTASAGFIIENKGTVDMDVALELIMPDGSKDTDLYFDENSKEWRLAISPSDTKLYPLKVQAGETLDWGALAVIAREVLPGTYTYTLNILSASESSSGGYVFEILDQVTLTVTVEGDIIPEETASEGEDSLLPGPSFLSVVGLLALIVLRRKN